MARDRDRDRDAEPRAAPAASPPPRAVVETAAAKLERALAVVGPRHYDGSRRNAKGGYDLTAPRDGTPADVVSWQADDDGRVRVLLRDGARLMVDLGRRTAVPYINTLRGPVVAAPAGSPR